MAQTSEAAPSSDGEPTVRRFNFRRDCNQVLDFQYEVYETNFPGFVADAFFVQDYRRDLRRSARDPNEALFMMEEAGVVCGFAWASVISTIVDARVGYIKNVYVAPHLRGRGQAERLMAAAEQWLGEQGIDKIMLDASVVNARAIRFYEKLGYVVERVRMVKRCGAWRETGGDNRGTTDG